MIHWLFCVAPPWVSFGVFALSVLAFFALVIMYGAIIIAYIRNREWGWLALQVVSSAAVFYATRWLPHWQC